MSASQPLLSKYNKPEFRVVVCGSSDYQEIGTMSDVLSGFRVKFPKMEIIQGGSNGADTIALSYACHHKLTHKSYPIKRSKYGKNAYGVRNQKMISEENPDVVLIFHSDVNSSANSLDLIVRALDLKIQTLLIPKDMDSLIIMTDKMIKR